MRDLAYEPIERDQYAPRDETGAVLTDVDIPFGRLVAIFIRCALAAIPALLVVGFVLMLPFMFFWYLGGL